MTVTRAGVRVVFVRVGGCVVNAGSLRVCKTSLPLSRLAASSLKMNARASPTGQRENKKEGVQPLTIFNVFMSNAHTRFTTNTFIAGLAVLTRSRRGTVGTWTARARMPCTPYVRIGRDVEWACGKCSIFATSTAWATHLLHHRLHPPAASPSYLTAKEKCPTATGPSPPAPGTNHCALLPASRISASGCRFS